MCTPAAPTPPNVADTAAAQTQSNIATATAQQNLNLIDQVGPNGTLKYTQIGTNADGTPKYQATTSLSPTGQALYDTNAVTAQNLAGVAKDASGRIGGLLARPLDFSEQTDYLDNLVKGALDKTWAQDESTLRASLADKGLTEGSTAFENELSNFRKDKSAAYDAAHLNDFSTGLSTMLALRETPLNEILALAGQGQVAQPNFVSTPQAGVGGTDIAGLTNSNYQQQVNAYNSQQQQLGGLFGTIGKVGAAALPFILG